MNETATAEQTVLEPAATPQQKRLMAMIAGMETARPSLKGRMTVAAAWYYMQLPDKSYGWVDGKTKMGDAEKMLVIATTLALDLMPGLGHTYFLGNNIYISTEAYREKAKKFIKSRKPRMCEPTELAMLDYEEGDKAIAIDFVLTFEDGRGEFNTTGYGIIEASQLAYKSQSGKALPGLGNKKDRFQTICTRAERDVFKHHIELHGARLEPDVVDRENMIEARVIPRSGELPSASETNTVIKQMNDKAETEHSANWLKETQDLFMKAVNDKIVAGVPTDAIKEAIGCGTADLLNKDVKAIEAAIEAVRDIPEPGLEDRE